jgi:hypothetical protein
MTPAEFTREDVLPVVEVGPTRLRMAYQKGEEKREKVSVNGAAAAIPAELTVFEKAFGKLFGLSSCRWIAAHMRHPLDLPTFREPAGTATTVGRVAPAQPPRSAPEGVGRGGGPSSVQALDVRVRSTTA